MRKYLIFLIVIAFLVVMVIIDSMLFQAKVFQTEFVLKNVENIEIPASVSLTIVYANRPVKVRRNTIYVPKARPGETVELYFENFGPLKRTAKTVLYFHACTDDSDEDGYPDSLELDQKDSARFRNWFINIALDVFMNDSAIWNEKERDCAGLIRFCAREALRKHDSNWLKRSGYKGPILPDVEKYNYPHLPLIGDKLFRIVKGRYNSPDEFGTFAVARILVECSMRFVSKDVKHALPGDVLVFMHPEDFEMPYHTMIYLGKLGTDQDWILYHTGPINQSTGELRLVKLESLSSFDPSWEVSERNKYFLGFYRFKFLN
ncbi:DUF1175 domain-containing protein [Pseudothermotoga thermarum]|uniref:DUF1175 domain-containing protein n=1 Tax=Pseudothermotoga thermarum DSM 5069 TaxID=688269 RepID=F7YWB3_9THEM|nr:DUF1175 domain-containing protein [Pseudothermotoga thermarum]AEH51888.1 protein of unknown function DUF1175 [Pseudothermotoga thermarum DSM 5069]